MRLSSRTIPALGAAAAACILAGGTASASAAPSDAHAQVALTGNIAGNVRITNPGDTDTFVFTETSQAGKLVSWFIQPFAMTGLTITNGLCVYPTHQTGGADGYTCEPYLRPAQTTSLVLTAKVTGAAGSTASVKVCAYNGGAAGFAQVCKTLSVTING